MPTTYTAPRVRAPHSRNSVEFGHLTWHGNSKWRLLWHLQLCHGCKGKRKKSRLQARRRSVASMRLGHGSSPATAREEHAKGHKSKTKSVVASVLGLTDPRLSSYFSAPESTYSFGLLGLPSGLCGMELWTVGQDEPPRDSARPLGHETSKPRSLGVQ